jgi:hypothetical protein
VFVLALGVLGRLTSKHRRTLGVLDVGKGQNTPSQMRVLEILANTPEMYACPGPRSRRRRAEQNVLLIRSEQQVDPPPRDAARIRCSRLPVVLLPCIVVR